MVGNSSGGVARALAPVRAPGGGARRFRYWSSRTGWLPGCAGGLEPLSGGCMLAGFEKVALQFAVAIDTGPARVDRGVPKVFWLSAGTVTKTAIFLAVGARRKPRDQHRDNKTLVSSDFAEVEETSAPPYGFLYGNRGVCFLPLRRAIPALIGGNWEKSAVTGGVPADPAVRDGLVRPASRGSAKPAPTTLAPPISRGAPVSEPASRGSAKPAPTTLRLANLTWSAGLRPASRGSAKPAPTTLAPPISRGAPVSDRHRAGARNPHQRR